MQKKTSISHSCSLLIMLIARVEYNYDQSAKWKLWVDSKGKMCVHECGVSRELQNVKFSSFHLTIP